MTRTLAFLRRALVWAAMGVAVAGSAALAVFLFILGHMIDPLFYGFFAALVGGLIGICCWLVWEVRRTKDAARDVAEERLVDPKEIAEYRPPARRRDPRRWLRYFGHSPRTKEVAKR